MTSNMTLRRDCRSLSSARAKISRWLERCLTVSSHYLFPPYQSAYSKFHSTKPDTGTSEGLSDICHCYRLRSACNLSLVDLVLPLILLTRYILIQRLAISFGIEDTPLQWLQSYLIGRTHSVRFTNLSTSQRNVCYGVSQGTWDTFSSSSILLRRHRSNYHYKHGLLHHCYDTIQYDRRV